MVRLLPIAVPSSFVASLLFVIFARSFSEGTILFFKALLHNFPFGKLPTVLGRMESSRILETRTCIPCAAVMELFPHFTPWFRENPE